MKNYLLIFAFCLFLSVPAFAQFQGSQNLSLGIATGAFGIFQSRPVMTGNAYLFGVKGSLYTATNSGNLTANRGYALYGELPWPVTISTLAVRSGATNNSVGVSLKGCIYAVGTDGKPGARLAQQTNGTSVTDNTQGTEIDLPLDSPVSLPAGPIFFEVLQSAATSGFRATVLSSGAPYTQVLGATSLANAIASTPAVGYYASHTYTTGCPDPFGSATAQTDLGTAPAIWYLTQ